MVTIAQAARQVKDDLPSLITPALNHALEAHPHFVWRNRTLNPLNLMVLFITQVMHGNTAANHLRHLSHLRFTAAAYCKARIKLPLTVIEMVSRNVSTQLRNLSSDDIALWSGHRVWYADGTSFSMPDTPDLQHTFGQPGGQSKGCGFPVSTMLVLMDAVGFIVRTLAMPINTHDASQLHHLHEQLEPGDVLVYDRAGCSYTHFALLCMRNLHGIIRLHQRQIVSFRVGRRCTRELSKDKRAGRPKSRWIKHLGSFDQIVEWYKPGRRPRWMPAEEYESLPDSLLLRELCYAVRRRGFRTKQVYLVTTLLDAGKYPKEALTDRYFDRWQIELNFRHLKQTMGMDVLKCRTAEGVKKELAVFVLVYNLVRLVMVRESKRRRVAIDRVSFIDALRWLCSLRGGADELQLIVNPKRPDRLEPRVVKRRPKQYPSMTRPRAALRKMMEKHR